MDNRGQQINGTFRILVLFVPGVKARTIHYTESCYEIREQFTPAINTDPARNACNLSCDCFIVNTFDISI